MSLLDTIAARMRPSFETMVATGAAVITGAAVYLMPIELLQNAVIASGLPDVVPQLDPPLGSKAKIGLALVAAGFAFGLVALLVRLFVGKAKPKVKVKAKAAKEAEPAGEALAAPRLRRRDRHPDAPARAPLSIGREIAELDEETPRVVLARKIRPERTSVTAATPEVAAPVPVTEHAEPVAKEVSPVDPFVSSPFIEAVSPSAERPVAEPPPPATEPAPVTSPPAWLDIGRDDEAERRAPTLAELLERLEVAMARRMPAHAGASQPPISAAPLRQADDERLRSALESLKRYAPGRG